MTGPARLARPRRLDRDRARVERDPRPALPDDRRMSPRADAPALGSGRGRRAGGRAPGPARAHPGRGRRAPRRLALVRQRGGRQRHLVRARIRGDRACSGRTGRASRRSCTCSPGCSGPSDGVVAIRGTPTWRNPAVYRDLGLVPERESVHPFLTGFEFAQLNARLQRLPDPDGAARRAIATVGLDGRRGPGGRHLLQGDAPAGQDRRAPSSTTPRSCSSTSRSTGWIPASASR